MYWMAAKIPIVEADDKSFLVHKLNVVPRRLKLFYPFSYILSVMQKIYS